MNLSPSAFAPIMAAAATAVALRQLAMRITKSTVRQTTKEPTSTE